MNETALPAKSFREAAARPTLMTLGGSASCRDIPLGGGEAALMSNETAPGERHGR
jgi:hypothetical protein